MCGRGARATRSLRHNRDAFPPRDGEGRAPPLQVSPLKPIPDPPHGGGPTWRPNRQGGTPRVLVGAAATLRARSDLPIDEHLALLDMIVKEAVVLERICLAPKIIHPSETQLDPTPTLRERTPVGEQNASS